MMAISQPDIKIIEPLVYITTEHATGIPMQEDSSWKLWIPRQL